MAVGDRILYRGVQVVPVKRYAWDDIDPCNLINDGCIRTVWRIAAHERSYTAIEYIRSHIRNQSDASGSCEIGAVYARIHRHVSRRRVVNAPRAQGGQGDVVQEGWCRRKICGTVLLCSHCNPNG